VVNLGKGLIQASKTQSVDDENILLAMKTPSQIKCNLFFRFTPIFSYELLAAKTSNSLLIMTIPLTIYIRFWLPEKRFFATLPQYTIIMWIDWSG